jgi:predicted TIM-barrel fold metal-dependent hydrolase
MYSQEQLLPWVEALREDVPGLSFSDAHTHLGLHDPAGLEATSEELLEALEDVDSRALVFPLKEPAGYREANEKMLELAAAHPERLNALARLDPADDPLGEAERCLDGGAVGLKLHPRGEDFDISDSRLDEVFALSDARRLPIMIHAGVGDPEVGPDTITRAKAHANARLILAHCAVGAFDRVLPHVNEVPNLFFDTSWWNPGDVWGLLRLVPPSRVLYASDLPFGGPAQSIVLTGRMAMQAGLDSTQIQSIMGGQLERLINHEEALDVGPRPEDVPALPPDLERLYVTLCTVVEPMLRGEPPGQGFGLAKVCTEAPVGNHAHMIDAVRRLLDAADEKNEPDPLRPLRTPGFDLVLAAAVVARTPQASTPT